MTLIIRLSTEVEPYLRILQSDLCGPNTASTHAKTEHCMYPALLSPSIVRLVLWEPISKDATIQARGNNETRMPIRSMRRTPASVV